MNNQTKNNKKTNIDPELMHLYEQLAFYAQQNKKIEKAEKIKEQLEKLNAKHADAILFLLQQRDEHKQLIEQLYQDKNSEALLQAETSQILKDNPLLYLVDMYFDEDVQMLINNAKRKAATKEHEELLLQLLKEAEQEEDLQEEATMLQEYIEDDTTTADIVIEELQANEEIETNKNVKEHLPEIIQEVNKQASVYDLEAAYGRKAEGQNYVTEQSVPQTPYDAFSKEKQIAMLTGSELFQMTDTEICQLCQSIHNTYCKENGLPPCEVKFGSFYDKPGTFTFAQYNVGDQSLVLNEKLLDFIHACKENGVENEYIGACMLSNIYHESRHRLQFHNIDVEEQSGDYSFVTSMLKLHETNHAKSFAEYFASAEEQDARNAALLEMHKAAEVTQNPKLLAYYKVEHQAEVENRKKYMGSTLESAHAFGMQPDDVEAMEALEARLFPNAYTQIASTESRRNFVYDMSSHKNSFYDFALYGKQMQLVNQHVLERKPRRLPPKIN